MEIKIKLSILLFCILNLSQAQQQTQISFPDSIDTNARQYDPPISVQQQQQQQSNPPIQRFDLSPSAPQQQQFAASPSQSVSGEQQALSQIYNGFESFSKEAFQRMSEILPESDFIISPISIWSLIMLLTDAAKGNTLSQIQATLGLPIDDRFYESGFKQIHSKLNINSPAITIKATQLLVSDKNRPPFEEFVNRITKKFNSDVLSVDFTNTRSFDEIQNFVSAATNGKIKSVLGQGDLKSLQMMLISALYFNAQWMSPFNSTFTADEPFFDSNGLERGRVNMMFQRGVFPYIAWAELDSHLLEIPYGRNGEMSMILFLPRKGVTLASVAKKISNMPLSRIFDELKKSNQDFDEEEVEVHIPRFSTVSDFNLPGLLSEMGITSLFYQEEADLSRSSKYATFISHILHKVQIEVTEEGTVAASLSAGVFANKATPPRFYANRPFSYMIIEKVNNVPLFCGQVQNPNTFRF